MCIIGITEFGACGLMKEIKDGNMYMQTSSVADGLRIFIVEEIIYEIFFNLHFSPSEIRKIRLNMLSPVIGNLIEKG